MPAVHPTLSLVIPSPTRRYALLLNDGLNSLPPSFPTRRSSDLTVPSVVGETQEDAVARLRDEGLSPIVRERASSEPVDTVIEQTPDRKSTRLNSSHLVISYAVFCLKKQKYNRMRT